MRRSHLGLGVFALAATTFAVVAGGTSPVSAATEDFTTPGTHSFVVPDGITQIQVEACGASGGTGGDSIDIDDKAPGCSAPSREPG